MCSEYAIKTRLENINQALEEALQGQALENRMNEAQWAARVKISQAAPVIESNGDRFQLSSAIFPVQPFPNARLSGAEDSEHHKNDETQIKRIYERPTWKKSFVEHRCLIPMTSFFEPVYWGPAAGSVVEFTPEKEDLLFVAGIKIKSRVPASQKLNAFAMLTHTPTPQILKYHHRMLVFLKPKNALAWLAGGPADAREKFDELIKNRYLPVLSVSKDRQMAKGWEKRIEPHSRKLQNEQNYLNLLKTESVAG